MTTSLDDLLIGVFLSISIAFIILWGIAILKWRKKFLHAMVPCFAKKKKKKKARNVEAKSSTPETGPQIAVISNVQTSSPVKYAEEGDKFTNPGFEPISNNNELMPSHVNRSSSSVNSADHHINNKTSKPPLSSSSLTNNDRDANNNNNKSRAAIEFVERIDVKPLENDIQIKVEVVEDDQEEPESTPRHEEDEVYDDSNPFKDDEVYSTPASLSKFSHVNNNSSSLSSDATCIVLSEIRL